ncbi:hypothetical protein K1719_028758 [Acacia pycnantha]|nr:hypothetical protein K1719_045395 [Acacia pycnantha]KAI9090423.1 hypothetical protein K1719_028758 [Acacia pycnantha]
MASEEERHLETQLELQLQEQRDSLSAINEPLVSDSSNLELLAVYEELVQAINQGCRRRASSLKAYSIIA